MAKKMDKAVKELAKELKKLRKENEKLAKTLGKTREDQAESYREILALLDERLPAGGTDETEDHPTHDEDGGFVTAETASEGGDGDVPEASVEAQQEGPEVTEAASRRARELVVDPTTVEGTGSGGRVLVKDVEAAAS